MTDKKTEALKLALSVLDEVRSETFRLLRNGQKLYAEEKVWNAIFVIKQALADQCVCGEPDTPGKHRTDGPCLAEQPAQQQEPVAWYGVNIAGVKYLGWKYEELDDRGFDVFPLYTSPPASKPLTDEQVAHATAPVFMGGNPSLTGIARAIESAHGIKGDA